MSRTLIGHPVDVATGTVHATYQDFAFPGRLPLAWKRTYRTPQFQATSTPLGPGWTAPYFARIKRLEHGYELFSPEGDAVVYPAGSRAGVVRNLGNFSELSVDPGKLSVLRWDMFRGARDRLVFAPHPATTDWLLVGIEVPGGQGIDVIHDDIGRVSLVRQRREGRGLKLTYDGRRGESLAFVEFVAAAGSSLTMLEHRYDGAGRLVEVQRLQQGNCRYDYDQAGRLVMEETPAGARFFFTYDAGHRCVHTFGESGYDEKRLRYFDHIRWTEVTNSHGSVRRFQWNAEGQVLRQISPLNGETLSTYDEHGRPGSHINPGGTVTRYAFDAGGNLSRLETSGMPTYEMAYADGHLLAEVRSSAGARWRLDYASGGRLQTVQEPRGLSWQLVWSGVDVREVRNSAGAAWRYEYDGQGQLCRVADAIGGVQSFEYDAEGFTVATASPAGGTTRFERDSLGRSLRTTNPDGSTVTKTYTLCGLLESVTNEAGRVLTIEYGQTCTRVAAKRYADGTSCSYQWGSEPWELLGIIDRAGEEHRFTYNEDGFPAAYAAPDGRETQYRRNAAGDVLSKTTGGGSTTYSRDVSGRITLASFPDSTSAAFTYDDNGWLRQAAYDGIVVDFERDQLGRRTRETGPGYTIGSEYDAAGRRTRIAMSPGYAVAADYTPYGALARLVSPGLFEMSLSVDPAGREVRRDFVVGASRLSFTQNYDPNGRSTSQQAATGASAGRAPDTARMVVARRYEYDRLGRIYSVFHSLWGSTKFTYDLANRVLRADDDAGSAETFTYDANGNLLSIRLMTSLAAADLDPSVSSLAFNYGTGDQLTATSRERFAYDNDGRVIRREHAGHDGTLATTRYEWNGLGLIRAVTLPDGSRWTYRYDALGRRLEKTGPSGVTRFIYDGNVVCWTGSGRQGQHEQWFYRPGSYTPIAKIENRESYAVLTDLVGTPTELVDASGEIRWSGRYRLWGQLRDERRRGAECLQRFPGHWSDPETGLHYNNCRYYDPALGRYLSPDPLPASLGDNAYAYVANPLWWIDPLGLVANYFPVDGQNRPTGGFGDLTPADRNTGTSASVDPPGWTSGTHPDHQQRSHLIAGSLGGSGSDERNIVALTDGSNNPGMANHERTIRDHLDADPNNRVLMEVHVEYDGDSPTPRAVKIYAIDQDGNVLVDDTVMNGQRQNTSCCI